jgi:IclR family KDG regulon transcriptional repressor
MAEKPNAKMKSAARPGKKALAPPPLPEKETGTVKRVLMLLRMLADHPGESAQSLAERLNLPRSTVHRLLATLRANEFALHEADGSFGPGLEMYRMAGRLGARMPYRRLAAPYLEELSARFNETAILSLLARPQLRMFHAATCFPQDPMRYNIELNRLDPLLWGATCRVQLAYLTEDEIAAAAAQGDLSPVKKLRPDLNELRKSLARIRTDGYAITQAHRTANAVGVAAPFFDGENEIAGSLGFLIPEFRWSAKVAERVVAALRDSAGKLTRQLGGAPR